MNISTLNKQIYRLERARNIINRIHFDETTNMLNDGFATRFISKSGKDKSIMFLHDNTLKLFKIYADLNGVKIKSSLRFNNGRKFFSIIYKQKSVLVYVTNDGPIKGLVVKCAHDVDINILRELIRFVIRPAYRSLTGTKLTVNLMHNKQYFIISSNKIVPRERMTMEAFIKSDSKFGLVVFGSDIKHIKKPISDDMFAKCKFKIVHPDIYSASEEMDYGVDKDEVI